MFFIIIIFFSICWTINYLKFRSEIASLKENPEAKIIPLSSHNLYQKKTASSEKGNGLITLGPVNFANFTILLKRMLRKTIGSIPQRAPQPIFATT